MKLLKVFIFFILFSFFQGYAQKSVIYTHDLVDFNHAVQLYSNKDYVASQLMFEKIKNDFIKFLFIFIFKYIINEL